MADLSDWYKSLPTFTRWWITLTLVFSLLGRFGVLRPHYMVLLYEPVKQFQIWRLATSVFYYPITPATGFHFLINCYFLYQYSKRLEMGVYASKPADYLFMLLFNWICCIIVGLLGGIMLLMDPMVLSMLYVWCQLNPDAIVKFWFGTRFKAMYLPWVLFLFNLVISGGGIMELVGIIVGHLYFFLMFKFPQELGGPNLLTTPILLKHWFPDQRGGVHGFGMPPQNRAQPAPQPQGGGFFRAHNWGQGNVLGGN